MIIASSYIINYFTVLRLIGTDFSLSPILYVYNSAAKILEWG